jgi:hypothetical protein
MRRYSAAEWGLYRAMSTASASAAQRPAEHVSFESWLFRASPLGAMATSALIFALGASGFALVTTLAGYPLVGPRGLALDRLVPGVVSPLLLATALGLRRFIDVRQRAEAPAFAAILTVDPAVAAAMLRPASASHLVAPSLAGAVAGAVVAVVSVPVALFRGYPSVYFWQTALIAILCVLFARGVTLAARNGRNLRRVIDDGLRIELLHADRLAVIGRQSARNALVWLTFAALLCLYFVGGVDPGWPTLPILVVCMGIGLIIFLHPMSGVRRRIRAAKSAELDQVRDEIGEARWTETRDPAAAARLSGLIAYEARIHAVREWPFDQSTLLRIAAYVLIPAIPWFGQAVASDVIQRLAH